jgi:hypothetical protein
MPNLPGLHADAEIRHERVRLFAPGDAVACGLLQDSCTRIGDLSVLCGQHARDANRTAKFKNWLEVLVL